MISRLDPRDPDWFPDPSQALEDPNGLLAIGGDLSPARLRQAYRRGIFPWFGVGDPILWWSPDPRTILRPHQVHVSRSLRKRLRQGRLTTTFDQDFAAVIRACAQPRGEQDGTWLVPPMIVAYESLHREGLAHSVEVWLDGDLVGGLYGVAIGRVFFGESMFSRVADASKIALVQLCRRLDDWGFGLVDCQMRTDHLLSMGAIEIPRVTFQSVLARFCHAPGRDFSWSPFSPPRLDERPERDRDAETP